MLLLLYADDIILTDNQSSIFLSFISTLGKEFEPSDMGPLSYFFGPEEILSLLAQIYC